MIIFLPIALIVPAIIVWLWQRKPKLAFVVAGFLLLFSLIAPGIIRTFQAMMIYGTGDPQLMAGGISAALTGSIVGLILGLPILALIQWIARRKYKRRLAEDRNPDVFS